ncbi:hypothetical protein Cgig2_000049 [Carnegiea gigantea]|uniref:Uncharacterized protein n=1 Tax=Carnegiea gigantea TaxID=171969 RepID=A0A9Q1QU80_9CARY|nr:hypothetical protein Cgig2_000049 [Carnegiea gigantea]
MRELGFELVVTSFWQKPGGIMALLDEACMFPKSTPETFTSKLYQTYKNHKRLIKPKMSRSDFIISHYAGEVLYQSDQFLDKNKDYVVPEHQDLLSASKCPFVACLFPPLPEETTKSSNKSAKFSSIASRFKSQLQQLMDTLNSTEPHYIRCIKPNNHLKPSIFENVNILQQLRCGGVLEAIRISCAGFPTRRLFHEFTDRFGILAPEVIKGNYDEKVACQKILEKKGLKGYQIGKNKVFLRAGQMAELDARRTEVLSSAAKTIQCRVRTHYAHKRFIALREAAICVQAFLRQNLASKLFERRRKEAAAIRIQKNARKFDARKKYNQLRVSVLILQMSLRSMAARKEFWFRRQSKAATSIQSRWRCHKASSSYEKLKKASVVTQCRWRGRLARRELRKLKMAARESGALKEAKEKLERNVEDLTLRLQQEKQLRVDLEEAKAQEITKLKNSLQTLQKEMDETKSLLEKEQETVKKATEEATKLKDSLQTMQSELDETKSLLEKEQETAKKATEEATKLKETLQTMQDEIDETKSLLEKEQEAAKNAIEEATELKTSLQTMQNEIDETKSLLEKEREAAKNAIEEATELKTSLQTMQNEIDETKSLLEKEREAAKKAIEEAPPVIKETQVMVEDTEKINSLTAEVAGLKASLDEEKRRADESDRKLSEAQELSEERRKKLDDADRKKLELQETVNRLEDKFSDLESEIQLLRQQGVSITPTPTPEIQILRQQAVTPTPNPTPNKFLPGHSRSISQRGSESGHFGDSQFQDRRSFSMNYREHEAEERPQKSLNEKQQENLDLLIKCIAQPLGFAGNRPIAACIIYKCLVHWRSFEVERTGIFDRIIQTIGHAVEAHDDNEILAYWLSNASTLLLLLQSTLKASSATVITAHRRRSSAPLRMTQSFRGSPRGLHRSLTGYGIAGSVESSHQVDARYPALLFKQQLTAYVEKIYGVVRDNLKKEISPLLGLCIQAPRASRASLLKGSPRSVASSAAQQALITHWQGIVRSLGNYLNTLKANQVPPFLVRKLFTQIFSFINVQLFNSLLLRRECCSFSNGEYVKAGLAELEHWCYTATEEVIASTSLGMGNMSLCPNLLSMQYAGSAWDELKHIRQAIGFLVLHHKPKKSLDDISHNLCPVLNIQQLYRISTMYWDDKYGTCSVSPEVISEMRTLMAEDSNTAVSSSFLLDDDSSIPFSMDDITKSMDQIDILDVEAPPLLRANLGFSFLRMPFK